MRGSIAPVGSAIASLGFEHRQEQGAQRPPAEEADSQAATAPVPSAQPQSTGAPVLSDDHPAAVLASTLFTVSLLAPELVTPSRPARPSPAPSSWTPPHSNMRLRDRSV